MGPLPLRILAPVLMVLLWSIPAFAGRSASLYLDGAVIERDETARNGYLEFRLPASVRPESLRIRPVGSGRITRVQLAEREPDRKVARELTAMAERRELLQDRLKALAVREEIFRSAAKSQSAKAPRRTKTNPEPLAAIRQGTDYAITQLEGVYQARRRATRELELLEEKRAKIMGEDMAGGKVARVWLTPASGGARASYVQSDRSWQPRYEIRASGSDTARVAIFPGEIGRHRDEAVTLTLAALANAGSASSWSYRDAGLPLAELELPATRRTEAGGAVPLVTLTLSNASTVALPPGEFSCYCDGVYHGTGRLSLLKPGSTAELRCGGN